MADRDSIIAVAGAPKRELLEKRNSPELEQLMEQRKNYRYRSGEARLRPAESVDRYHLGVAAPIIAEGDLMGCVMLLLYENDNEPTESGPRQWRDFWASKWKIDKNTHHHVDQSEMTGNGGVCFSMKGTIKDRGDIF